jgi:hypothetical protein
MISESFSAFRDIGVASRFLLTLAHKASVKPNLRTLSFFRIYNILIIFRQNIKHCWVYENNGRLLKMTYASA